MIIQRGFTNSTRVVTGLLLRNNLSHFSYVARMLLCSIHNGEIVIYDGQLLAMAMI